MPIVHMGEFHASLCSAEIRRAMLIVAWLVLANMWKLSKDELQKKMMIWKTLARVSPSQAHLLIIKTMKEIS